MIKDVTYSRLTKAVEFMKQQQVDAKKLDSLKGRAVEKELKSVYATVEKNIIVRQKQALDLADRKGKFVKRRHLATLNLLDEVRSRLCDKYPDSFITKNYFFLSCTNPSSYDILNENNDLTLAAALWILDELKLCGKLEEAYKFFPKEYISRSSINIRSDIKDTEHDSVVINNMVSVIQSRNKDFNVKRIAIPRYILDDINITDRPYGESVHRKNYDSILALIPEERIKQAVETFREKFYERLDILSQIDSYYTRKRNEMLGKIETEIFLKGGSTVAGGARMVPFIKDIKSLAQMGGHEFIDDNGSRLMNELEELLKDDSEKFQLFCQTRAFSNEMLDELPENAGERVREWENVDPFATAFAVFYLADTRDDMLWAYGISFSIALIASKHMPWLAPYKEQDLELFDRLRKEPDSEQFSNRDLKHNFNKFFGFTSISGLDENEEDTVFEGRIPLGFLIYTHTGLIMPRHMHTWPGLFEELKGFGLDDNEAGYLNAIVNVVNTMKNTSKMVYELEDDDWEDEYPDEEDEEYDSSADSEALLEELERQREEIKRLKKDLYSVSKEKENIAAENEQLKASVDSMTGELANLREAVYYQGQEHVPELEEMEITFPYNAKHQIATFGGHDTWTKEIKLKIPNVTYYHRDKTPTAEMIRSKDIVFIQTNCLNHPAYWAVVDLCKRYKVKLRYFMNASAELSAKQIVKADQE